MQGFIEYGRDSVDNRGKRVPIIVFTLCSFFAASALLFDYGRSIHFLDPFSKDLGEGIAFVALLLTGVWAMRGHLRSPLVRILIASSVFFLVLSQVIDVCQELPQLAHIPLLGDTPLAHVVGKAAAYAAALAILACLVITILALDRERLRAENREYRYGLFTEAVTDVVWTMDLNLRHTYINPHVLQLRGYSVEEAMKQSLDDVLVPESLGLARAAFSDAIEKELARRPVPERMKTIELEMKRKDGYTVWTEVRVAALRDTHGTVTGLIGVTRDISERKRSEEALRASEERYRSFVNDLPIPVYRREPGSKGRILVANPAMARLLGCESVDELVHTPPAFFYVQPAEMESFETKLTAQGRVVREPLQLKRVTGEYVWVFLTLDAVRDSAGNVLYYDGLMEDKTEQRKALDALRVTEQHLDALMEGSEAGLFDWYPQTRRVVLPERWATMLGYQLRELTATVEGLRTLIYPEDFKQLQNAVDAHIAGNTPCFQVELRMKAKNGEWRWALVRGRVVERDEQGLPWRVTSTCLDITERNRSEMALRESEEKFRALAENSPDVVMRFDHQLRHLYASPAVKRETGIPASDFIGKTHRELGFPEELVERWEEALQYVFRTKNRHRIEFQLPSGLWLDWSLCPEFSPDGEVQAVLTSAREMTERKRAEQEILRAKEAAEEASQIKSRFLANVSHEIRTPLNSIIGFSETILNCDSLEQVHAQAETILKESVTLLTLIDDLLDHAKVEAGRLELEHAPFNLHEWFRETVAGFQVQAASKGLEFSAIMEGEPPTWLLGDPLRLRQIAANLLSNAIKFTEHGSVVAELTAIGHEALRVRLQLVVRDTGIGIPLDKQEAIFQSFHQADGSTTRKYGGTGLGTTIARQLTELMGGTLDLQSKEGQGSAFRFTVELEMCPAPHEASHRDKDAPESLQETIHMPGARILLVEDYTPNQLVARQHLESAGCHVELAANGQEAVQACSEHRFDLILMDIQMPEMDGYEATQLIRGEASPCRDVPIIAMTAHADPVSRTKCRKAGMNDVITKPLRRIPFLQSVSRWLASNPARPELDQAAGHEPALAPPTNTLPLDIESVVGEFGDFGLLRPVLEEFMLNVESQLASMRQAVPERNFDLVRRESHSIRGGAATLAAVPLSNAAHNLETLTLSREVSKLSLALDELGAQFEVFREYVYNIITATKEYSDENPRRG